MCWVRKRRREGEADMSHWFSRFIFLQCRCFSGWRCKIIASLRYDVALPARDAARHWRRSPRLNNSTMHLCTADCCRIWSVTGVRQLRLKTPAPHTLTHAWINYWHLHIQCTCPRTLQLRQSRLHWKTSLPIGAELGRHSRLRFQ